jgi:carbon-monoxide dehydrogenase small subunit
MKPISLVINGRKVEGAVEPRTSLVDFLRDHQDLTATHVGCEHGVCGACTILIDGVPARSCITLAVAADSAAITTLEGFEGDPAMKVLREAFSEHHGLQCGFCTPGMLMTARDIAIRLPDADEQRIRLELAGNLCRCTGYVGIVKAIESALTKLKDAPRGSPAARGLGPVGSHSPKVPRDRSRTSATAARAAVAPIATAGSESLDLIDWAAVEREGVELRQSFTVPFPRADVWRFFADLDQVVRCIPGARLTAAVQGGRAEGEVNVKLGPIVSTFQGVLDIARDDANYRGVVRGAGRDARSPSSARAIIAYDVTGPDSSTSRVDVSVKFLLSGALAQFSRGGLVKDVADHLTRVFAQNLEARLSGKAPADQSTSTLDAGAVARSAIWARIRNLAARLMGRGT